MPAWKVGELLYSFIFYVFILCFIQDTLIAAQRALAVVYEDSYPCSNSVHRGLRDILNQRFGGSHHDFNDKFLRPTISLLARLKAKVITFVCLF